MTQWYRQGINPQGHLPYLAAYLGHRDIHSTLVYLITQETAATRQRPFQNRGDRSIESNSRKIAMAKPAMPALPRLMHSFFHEWLVEQRNASHRTVLAYRDAWPLFLRCSKRKLRLSAWKT